MPGQWTLCGRKLDAGYSDQCPSINLLKGQRPLRVQVTAGILTHNIVLRLGPRAAFVHIDLIEQATRTPIRSLSYSMSQVTNPARWARGSQGAPADLLVPPTDIKLSITSDGYSTWTASESTHPWLTLTSGEHRTLTIPLKRITPTHPH